MLVIKELESTENRLYCIDDKLNVEGNEPVIANTISMSGSYETTEQKRSLHYVVEGRDAKFLIVSTSDAMMLFKEYFSRKILQLLHIALINI